MRVTFLLSAAELKTAQGAYSRRAHSLARRAQPWLSIAGPFFLALTLLFEGFAFFWHPHHSPDVFGLVLAPASLAVAAFSWWRQRYQPAFDYSKEQTFELTEDGISRIAESGAKVRVP